MKYRMKMADEVYIYELDYGDTFVFMKEPNFVYMFVEKNPLACFPDDISKMASEYLDKNYHRTFYFYVSLATGKLFICNDDCQVIPVRADEINFVPET